MMIYAVIISFIIFASATWASPAEEPKEFAIPILDAAEDFFSFRANSVANRLDSFFADQRADDELGRSAARIRTSYSMAERAVGDFRYQTRFNLYLPAVQERLKRLNYFESKKKKQKKAGVETRGFFLPGNIEEELNTKWQFRSDAGVNVSLTPRAFTRGRLRKNFYTGKLINRFVEEIGWYSDTRWMNIISLTTEKSLSQNMLLRFTNEVRWEITNHNGLSIHGPSLLQQISDKEALSYNIRGFNTAQGSTIFFSSFQLSTTYRRDLYRNKLYFDITPGLDFPKQWSYRRTPFILLQMEVLFGR